MKADDLEIDMGLIEQTSARGTCAGLGLHAAACVLLCFLSFAGPLIAQPTVDNITVEQLQSSQTPSPEPSPPSPFGMGQRPLPDAATLPAEITPAGGGPSPVTLSNIPEEEEAAPKVQAPPAKLGKPPESEAEVETTVFDLYLSDVFQGSILTRYTEDWIEVDDPRDLVDQLPAPSRTDEVRDLVSGRIYKLKTKPGVGSVRYDIYTFRIVLVLDKSLVPEKSLNLTARLPDPENELSFQQRFNGSVSSDVQGGSVDAAALQHTTLASVGKYLATVDGTLVKDENYVLTRASAGGIVDQYQVEGGLLQTAGQTFASSAEITGGSFQTSTDILLDQNLARGSKLELFVPSRSRVEFYREGRLLAVRELNFGLQEIDTSTFPDGSYNVDIVITEDNGAVDPGRDIAPILLK